MITSPRGKVETSLVASEEEGVYLDVRVSWGMKMFGFRIGERPQSTKVTLMSDELLWERIWERR